MQPETEAEGGGRSKLASRWAADVLFFSFAFSLLFILTGLTGMKEIREP